MGEGKENEDYVKEGDDGNLLLLVEKLREEGKLVKIGVEGIEKEKEKEKEGKEKEEEEEGEVEKEDGMKIGMQGKDDDDNNAMIPTDSLYTPRYNEEGKVGDEGERATATTTLAATVLPSFPSSLGKIPISQTSEGEEQE